MKRMHKTDASWHGSFALVSIIIHYCSCNGRGKGNGYSRQLPTCAGCIGRCNGITEQRCSLLGWRTASINNWARKKKSYSANKFRKLSEMRKCTCKYCVTVKCVRNNVQAYSWYVGFWSYSWHVGFYSYSYSHRNRFCCKTSNSICNNAVFPVCVGVRMSCGICKRL